MALVDGNCTRCRYLIYWTNREGDELFLGKTKIGAVSSCGVLCISCAEWREIWTKKNNQPILTQHLRTSL